jgi:hypothetical protein
MIFIVNYFTMIIFCLTPPGYKITLAINWKQCGNENLPNAIARKASIGNNVAMEFSLTPLPVKHQLETMWQWNFAQCHCP